MKFDQLLLDELYDVIVDSTNKDGAWVGSADMEKEPRIRAAIWKAFERWQVKNESLRTHPNDTWHKVSTICQMLKEKP
jgi:hypothetical protein